MTTNAMVEARTSEQIAADLSATREQRQQVHNTRQAIIARLGRAEGTQELRLEAMGLQVDIDVLDARIEALKAEHFDATVREQVQGYTALLDGWQAATEGVRDGRADVEALQKRHEQELLDATNAVRAFEKQRSALLYQASAYLNTQAAATGYGDRLKSAIAEELARLDRAYKFHPMPGANGG